MIGTCVNHRVVAECQPVGNFGYTVVSRHDMADTSCFVEHLIADVDVAKARPAGGGGDDLIDMDRFSRSSSPQK
jgi:hypothetical protein